MMLGKGEVTLVAGQATVALPRVPADAVIVLSPMTLRGTVGLLAWSLTPKSGFTITSQSALDTSVVRWAVFA